jgi:hypothetical protein
MYAVCISAVLARKEERIRTNSSINQNRSFIEIETQVILHPHGAMHRLGSYAMQRRIILSWTSKKGLRILTQLNRVGIQTLDALFTCIQEEQGRKKSRRLHRQQ